MGSKNVQDYLDKGIYGAKQIKPDEQNKFLGTFRERVIFILQLKEAKTTRFDSFCIEQFAAYKDGTLLINANCPTSIQAHFIQLAQNQSITFRIVERDKHSLSPDAIAIVFSYPTAIDLDDISAKDRPTTTSSLRTSPENKTEKKEHFLKRFFKF